LIRIAFDTNILVYLANTSATAVDAVKTVKLLDMMERLEGQADLVVPVQALGELNTVLRRNRVTSERSSLILEQWIASSENPPSTMSTLRIALDLSRRHRLQFWDSLVVAAASEAGCLLLLSEDMPNGFTVRGLTVVNPLIDKPHRALAWLFDG
jgi:predicted nucleic acid-binding protein